MLALVFCRLAEGGFAAPAAVFSEFVANSEQGTSRGDCKGGDKAAARRDRVQLAPTARPLQSPGRGRQSRAIKTDEEHSGRRGAAASGGENGLAQPVRWIGEPPARMSLSEAERLREPPCADGARWGKGVQPVAPGVALAPSQSTSGGGSRKGAGQQVTRPSLSPRRPKTPVPKWGAKPRRPSRQARETRSSHRMR